MKRASYLNNYNFNWDAFSVIIEGKSSLDANRYMSQFHNREDVGKFLSGYGFDLEDPIQNAELFGIFQESLQFIKRFFLKEGNPEGLDLKIPNVFFSMTDISELFITATAGFTKSNKMEESIWGGIILKIMHTILHADKDLRYSYFNNIQMQIFDRFYKYISRNEENKLFLQDPSKKEIIQLHTFETKSQKTRESIIIKLLHKPETTAEEVFDRIGVRFVTHNLIDCLRVVKFLHVNYVIMVNNIKPSRSHNTLIDLDKFKDGYLALIKNSIKEDYSEEEFVLMLNHLAEKCKTGSAENKDYNLHSKKDYGAIHFTCRQLIRYRNPFLKEFNEVKKMARGDESELAKKIALLDTSNIAKEVRFFYPYEVQIMDHQSFLKNTEGEASHAEYKKSQIQTAMKRIFRQLIDFKQISL
jgi:uncharacterized protein (TIGR04562 family)